MWHVANKENTSIYHKRPPLIQKTCQRIKTSMCFSYGTLLPRLVCPPGAPVVYLVNNRAAESDERPPLLLTWLINIPQIATVGLLCESLCIWILQVDSSLDMNVGMLLYKPCGLLSILVSYFHFCFPVIPTEMVSWSVFRRRPCARRRLPPTEQHTQREDPCDLVPGRTDRVEPSAGMDSTVPKEKQFIGCICFFFSIFLLPEFDETTHNVPLLYLVCQLVQ